MANNKIDQEDVKVVFKTALKVVADISTAAGTFNPIFSVVGSLINVALHHVDDEDLMKNLEREFEDINQNLDKISQQNQQTLSDIKKMAVDKKYADIEKNLRNQFRSYLKIVKAKPEHLQRIKDDFVQNYEEKEGTDNMNNLYDGVVGTRKLFSEPVLEVYQEISKGNENVMKGLCRHLAYLFCIGYTTMMTYYDFKGENIKYRCDEWEEKMKKLQGIMGKWM